MTSVALAPAGDAARAMLSVENLNAWYAESHVLHGVSFDVREGELLTLIGRNGAGKTTTLRSIMGIAAQAHRIDSSRNAGADRPARPTRSRVRELPTARRRGRSFPRCRCGKTCMLPPVLRDGGLSVEQLFEAFPNLKARAASQGTKLSGGEQQMLAIARILRTGARLLLLDEPSEGLAPVVVREIGEVILRLKRAGVHDPAGRAESAICAQGRRPPRRRRERQGGRCPERRRSR